MVKTKKNLYSAPMAGVTDKPFREMIRKFSNHPIYTEMISVSSLYHNHALTKKMLKIEDEKNIIVQLVGINENYFLSAAQKAQDEGAIAIDINMGCPVKKLITNGSGAALMKNSEDAIKIVDILKKNLQIPISAKIRIGWDDSQINAVDFSKKLEDAGLDRLTIHGRTKEQGYAGCVNFEIIQQVKEALKIPVIANGDVNSYEKYAEMINRTRADGVMIGRGLLGKPWLLNEIENEKEAHFSLKDIVLEHFEKMIEYYGKHGVFVARKHLAWYAKGLPNTSEICQKLYTEKEIDNVKKIIQNFYI